MSDVSGVGGRIIAAGKFLGKAVDGVKWVEKYTVKGAKAVAKGAVKVAKKL